MAEINPLENLTKDELEAYEKWKARKDPQTLTLRVSLQFYELFLNGVTCQQICTLNEEKFPLGQIVESRIKYNWDQRKHEHINNLFDNIGHQVRRTQLEGVYFLTSMLSSAHKQHGAKFRKFLQSGNEKDLGDMQISTVKAYREVLETLRELIGTSPAKNSPNAPIQVTGGNNLFQLKTEDTSKEAEIVQSEVLKFLEAAEEKKK